MEEKERNIIEDWDEHYREKEIEEMPWYYAEMDPDLSAVLKSLKIEKGRALDLGTGPGTQAIALAESGFEVTATDISGTAVKDASKRAAEKGLDINFIEDDILETRLDGEFDLIFDRGCFHTLQPDRRRDYVRIVHGLIRPGGYLFLKVMSHMEKLLEGGPYRFTPGDIHELFTPNFEVDSIDETVFHGTLNPEPLALFCILKKIKQSG